MILYTEYSRAELLNRVWVWLECFHLFLYMVIPGVSTHACMCVRVYVCVPSFPVSFSIQLFNAWCVHEWVWACSSTLQNLGHQLLLPRMLWQTHLNHFQEKDQVRIPDRPIRQRSHSQDRTPPRHHLNREKSMILHEPPRAWTQDRFLKHPVPEDGPRGSQKMPVSASSQRQAEAASSPATPTCRGRAGSMGTLGDKLRSAPQLSVPHPKDITVIILPKRN